MASTHVAPRNLSEEQRMLELALALSQADVSLERSAATNERGTAPTERSQAPQSRSTGAETNRREQRGKPRQNAGFPAAGSGRDACAACQAPLFRPGVFFRAPVVHIDGNGYHRECVRCSSCGKPLHSAICAIKGRLFCQPCAFEHQVPSCACCKGKLPAKASPEGQRGSLCIEYHESAFWGEKYCKRHKSDTSVRCTGCSRARLPELGEVAPLGDGRYICLECLASMIPDREAALPLYRNVMLFYASKGMPHREEPPLHLVEDSALNEYRTQEGRRGGAAPEAPVTHTRGLCLCERYERIRYAALVRGVGGRIAPRRGDVPVARQRAVHVTALLVLAGMPALLTGAVLAHELMHAWLRMGGFPDLPLQVEEGLCQLMAYLWLEAQSPKAGYEERLASYIGYQIRMDKSTVYGDGFRNALASFQEHGLERTLQHVKMTRELPC